MSFFLELSAEWREHWPTMVCFFLQEWNCFTPVLLPSSWRRAEAFISRLLTKVGNCCRQDLYFIFFFIILHWSSCPRHITHANPPPSSPTSHVPSTAVPLFSLPEIIVCTVVQTPRSPLTHTQNVFSSTSINSHSCLYLFLLCDTDIHMFHSSPSNYLSHTMRFLDTHTIKSNVQQKSPENFRVLSRTLRQGGGAFLPVWVVWACQWRTAIDRDYKLPPACMQCSQVWGHQQFSALPHQWKMSVPRPRGPKSFRDSWDAYTAFSFHTSILPSVLAISIPSHDFPPLPLTDPLCFSRPHHPSDNSKEVSLLIFLSSHC